KSNLLEAIELLATAKSSRAGSDRELMNWATLQADPSTLAEPFARIRATVQRETREVRAEVLVRDTGPADREVPAIAKTFRLNGVAKRALEFVGTVNVVGFS